MDHVLVLISIETTTLTGVEQDQPLTNAVKLTAENQHFQVN